MYRYPLTFTFPAFTLSPQITAKDASGAVILNASKKLLSSKEEINVTSNGKPLYNIISQESRITEIPSNWDIKTPDGNILGVVDDDYLSAVDTSKFVSNSIASSIMDAGIANALNMRAVKMYWINDTAGNHLGYVAPDQRSLVAMQLPFADIVRQLPDIFYRFVTPSYYVRYNEETKMILQKKFTFFTDMYVLEPKAAFSDAEEALLINSVFLTLVYERQALKDVYGS